MPLCKACKDFDLQEFRRYPDSCLTIRYKDLEIKSQAGCELCSLILEQAEDRRARSPYPTSWIRVAQNGEYDPNVDKTVGCTRLNVSVGEYRFEHKRGYIERLKSEDPPDEICVVADEGEQVFLRCVFSLASFID